MLLSQCHFDGPSAGPAEANGRPEAHGPPKVHEPRGHCTPCPPLSGPVRTLVLVIALFRSLPKIHAYK